MTYDEAYKFVEDNLVVEFENTLSKEKLAEIYEAIYEIKPRASYRKNDIAKVLRDYILSMHRTADLGRGLF